MGLQHLLARAKPSRATCPPPLITASIRMTGLSIKLATKVVGSMLAGEEFDLADEAAVVLDKENVALPVHRDGAVFADSPF